MTSVILSNPGKGCASQKLCTAGLLQSWFLPAAKGRCCATIRAADPAILSPRLSSFPILVRAEPKDVNRCEDVNRRQCLALIRFLITASKWPRFELWTVNLTWKMTETLPSQVSVHREGVNPSSMDGVSDLLDHNSFYMIKERLPTTHNY